MPYGKYLSYIMGDIQMAFVLTVLLPMFLVVCNVEETIFGASEYC